MPNKYFKKCPNCQDQMIQDIQGGFWRCLGCNYVDKKGAKNGSEQAQTQKIGS